MNKFEIRRFLHGHWSLHSLQIVAPTPQKRKGFQYFLLIITRHIELFLCCFSHFNLYLYAGISPGGFINKQVDTGGYTTSVGWAIYPFFYLYARSYLFSCTVVLTYGEDSNYTLLAPKEIRWDNELILLISRTDRGVSKSGAICRGRNDAIAKVV